DREDVLAAEAEYGVAWVGAMCRELDIRPPADIEAARLTRLTEVHVCTHTTATFAAARAAIEALRSSYALHTATGHFSWRVDALLANLGVLEHFDVRSGPDRVGAAKATARFYERLFAAAHVEPSSALVVDDNPAALELAASVGARTALVDPALPEAPFDLVLAGIEELPGALANL
ncbi:MAG: HAD hydrolase-like protein, partial [Dehalococcoidia bacterium]